MHRFEAALEDCLEGLRSGRMTLEDCLSRYPRWAERLAPLLRVAASLGETLADEAADTTADPAFREEMRSRFLTLGAARPAVVPKSRYRPDGQPSGRWWAPPLRLSALATRPVMIAVLAFFVGFVGFSSFTVITAANALPGDWRYPVKRAGEQVRLTFTFDDNARRGLHISYAEERLSELERLASNERTIPAPVLRDLANATDDLGQNLDSVPPKDVERIGVLAQKQQETLLAVEPLVEPEAQDELQVALQTSGEVYDGAVHALALANVPGGEEPPEAASEATSEATGEATPEATPSAEAGATGTAEPAAEAAAPGASPTPEESVGIEPTATPSPESTSVSVEPTSEPSPVEPTATPPTTEPSPVGPTATPPVPERRVVFLPDDTTAGITWNLITIGDFSLRVPADAETEWAVSTLAVSDNESIFVGHRWSNSFDAVVVVDVSTGEASVHVLIQGTILRVEREQVPSLVPKPVSSVIFHVLESINAGP